MNNNLWKELAEQADAYAYAKIGMSFDYHPDWHGVRDEKFAELLIRECAFVAQNKDSTNIDLRYGRGLAADKIFEHFGY